MNLFSALFKYMLAFVLPVRCIGCKSDKEILCAHCVAALPPANQPNDHFIFALFDYNHPILKRSIWKFKYENARTVAKPLGRAMYDHMFADLAEGLLLSAQEKILLIPIPLHSKRLRERGFNQSELLVQEIARNDTSSIFEVSTQSLKRIRPTPSQAKKEHRNERLKNLRGVFSADPEAVRGKDIILVDDVSTTGATMSEARKSLLAAKARSVLCYAVAH